MVHLFKIKGIIAFDSWYGDEFTPDMLDEQLAIADGADLLIDINSIGGCVHSGIAIYTALKRYARDNNAAITTRTDGFVASIATAIFLAGDRRIVNEFMQPFIHEPFYEWADAQTADEFKKSYTDLEKTKNLIAEFYSKTTNLSIEDALEIMANDTWMSAGECLAVGFATEIEELSKSQIKIVAKFKNKMSKPSKMAWYERLANALKVDVPKAELKLTSVDEKVITFPNLEENATPKIDDAIVVDEDANFTGEVETEEFVITSADGVVTAILDKTEIDEEEVIEDLLAKVETLEEALNKANSERDKYAKLYNAIGSKSGKPDNGKEKKDGKDGDPSKEAVNKIKERLKNKK